MDSNLIDFEEVNEDQINGKTIEKQEESLI